MPNCVMLEHNYANIWGKKNPKTFSCSHLCQINELIKGYFKINCSWCLSSTSDLRDTEVPQAVLTFQQGWSLTPPKKSPSLVLIRS